MRDALSSRRSKRGPITSASKHVSRIDMTPARWPPSSHRSRTTQCITALPLPHSQLPDRSPEFPMSFANVAMSFAKVPMSFADVPGSSALTPVLLAILLEALAKLSRHCR